MKSRLRTTARLASLWLCVIASNTFAVPEVLGWLEGAYLQPWGVRVRAKLDTGALTSSLDAQQIEKFDREGETWVRFTLPHGAREGFADGVLIETPLRREATIKEHVGENAVRYVVDIDVCLSGETYSIEFTLADRSKFNYPMIIGRRALAGRYLVDAQSSFNGKRTCPRRDADTGLVQ